MRALAAALVHSLVHIAGACFGASHGESMGLEGGRKAAGISNILIPLILFAGFDP